MSRGEPLFDAAFLGRLEYLSLVSKRVFRGRLLAQRRTAHLGSGVEFAEHREYSAGDDFRYLDWNLYARHDELLLKRFQEEEDLHAYLLVDVSRSMAVGDPSKFDLARRLAAAFAYLGLADLDRVAVVAFADDIVADFPLTRGKDRILAVMRFLERLEPSSAVTDLERVARSFVLRSQRRGVVVLLSDLFDPRGFERGLDVLRHRLYEPHIIHVHDVGEAEPARLGDVELVDVESGAARRVTVTEKRLARYRVVFAAFLESIRRYAWRYGLSYSPARTDVAFDELLLRMMRTGGVVQ